MTEAKVPNWGDVLSVIEKLLGHLPKYITIPVGVLLLILLIMSLLAAIVAAIGKILDIWRSHLRPATYSPEQKDRVHAQRLFAQHLTHEVVVRNRAEDWRDQEFTELEAEVEAEGRTNSFFQMRDFIRRNNIRRERSLSTALRRSKERLVLVEGEPGSGKSVALRHVSLVLSSLAEKARSVDAKLPVYVNLKDIKRYDGEAISRDLIRRHVLHTINRVSDRFVDEYLDTYFDDHIKKGVWIFLFDSFDEIPDILSSTHSDNLVESYSQAITDFLSGINSCRGVVASRSYRGPERLGWKTFRILPLSDRRQKELIKKSLINTARVREGFVTSLAEANADVREMAKNPMLLGLLCEHVKLGYPFPSSGYQVMERYVEYRLQRDRERLRLRFSLSAEEVADTAELSAFVMTADASIGLSPTVRALVQSTRTQGLLGDEGAFKTGLEALSYLRLARLEGVGSLNCQEFTFAHRRFQEYFATKVVIGSSAAVDAHRLLSDARWRETAVVLLQTGGHASVKALVNEAEQLLLAWVNDIDSNNEVKAAPRQVRPWAWPLGAYHVLGILEAGARLNPAALPKNVRRLIATIVRHAFLNGNILDKKLALEVSGGMPRRPLIALIEAALLVGSRLLDDVVYRQASRLPVTTSHIDEAVRNWVLRLSNQGELRSVLPMTRAYVARLPNGRTLAKSVTLALWIPRIDLLLLAAAFAMSPAVDAAARPGVFLILTSMCVGASFAQRRMNFSPISMISAGLLKLFCLMALIMSTFTATVAPHTSHSPESRPGDPLSLFGRLASTFGALSREEVVTLLLTSLFAFLAMSWLPSSETAVKNGKFDRPVEWVAIPFYGATRVVRRMIMRRGGIRRLIVTILIIPFYVYVFRALNGELFFDYFIVPLGAIITAAVALFVLGYCFNFGRDCVTIAKMRGSLSVFENLSESYWQMTTHYGSVLLLRRAVSRPLRGDLGLWSNFASEALNKRVEPAERGLTANPVEGSEEAWGKGLKATLIAWLTFRPLRFIDQEAVSEHRDLLFVLLERASGSVN